MSAATWVAVGLALITVVAWARLAIWARRATNGARTRGWRLAILMAAQPLMAMLLYLTLFPPPRTAAGMGTLIVATRGAPRLSALTGARRIDLPEAPAGLGGEPAPDLATALRRNPGVTRLRILGEGLEPRDRDAASGLAIDFAPPPLRGLTALHPPQRVAPGAAFQINGKVDNTGGGSVELLDAAGRLVDTQPLNRAGEFVLSDAARDPGPALFTVQVRDARHSVVEVARVPVWVTADPGPKVLLLAGAPGPEVKQLRRWALDTGVALQTLVGAGDGLVLGEARPHLETATLDRLDLVVVDERSWSTLGAGERAALIAATRGGMGLLLRVTGPIPTSVREQWSAAFGLPLGAGDESAVVQLPPNASPPSPSSAMAEPQKNALPQLTRRVIDAAAPDSVLLGQDAGGGPLGRWRAVGRGRAGVWAVTDSSGLVTAGFADRYGELWSTLFATLARASLAPASFPDAPSVDTPRAGQRVSLCGIGDGAQVLGPNGGDTRLYVDPAAGPTGCAGYWPTDGGWRLVRTAAAEGTERQDRPLYLYSADAMPGVRAQELRDDMWKLASESRLATRSRAQSDSPGPAWPWLLMLLTALASVWHFERARTGVNYNSPPAPRTGPSEGPQ